MYFTEEEQMKMAIELSLRNPAQVEREESERTKEEEVYSEDTKGHEAMEEREAWLMDL